MKQQVAQRQLHHHPHHHYRHLGGGKQQQTLVYRWTNMFDESEPVSAVSKIRNLCVLQLWLFWEEVGGREIKIEMTADEKRC